MTGNPIPCVVVACLVQCRADPGCFDRLRTERIESSPIVEWKNFGPGMSGYCEEFWCHPTDTNAMFMGPDMHVSFGTWDNGRSWQTLKDCDGLGIDMKRVLEIDFSRQDPDFGMALDWNGWVYTTTNRGRAWTVIHALGDGAQGRADPDDPESFSKGWYYGQIGRRHSALAVDPSDDNIWYVGAGDFWNVKSNHRSAAKPNGVRLPYAAYGCIWKSVDKGSTWRKITAGLDQGVEVGRIVVHPKDGRRLVMATSHGLMLSNDGGLSWRGRPIGLPNNLPRDLTSYYNPATGEFVLYLVEQTIYEARKNTVEARGGVFKSVDGGLRWIDMTGNLPFDLDAIGDPRDTGRYYRTLAYWFGLSEREAESRFPRLPPKILPVFNRIAVSPMDKNEIYLSYNKKHDFTFGPGDLWRTLDGGKTWITCARHGAYWLGGKGDAYWKERKNPVGTNIRFAHLQRYMDEQWEISGTRMLAVNAAGELFIGIDQQTLKSTDRGVSWEQIDDVETSAGSGKWIGRGGSNLPGRYMLLETGIPGRKLLCSGEHGLWQTVDLDGWPDKTAVAVQQIEGQNHPDGAVSISTVAVHPRNPDMIYILSWRQDHRGKVRRTTDGGRRWENIATLFAADNDAWDGLVPQNSLTIDPQHPENIYFCATCQPVSEVEGRREIKLTKGGCGFYRSFDGGFNWELANNGFYDGASVRRIAMHPQNPSILYAALNDDHGGLFRTDDKGSQWTRVALPEAIRAVNNVFIDRNTLQLYICTGRRLGTFEEGGVWRSNDNGTTWERIFKAPFVWQAETSPADPELIVASVAGVNVRDEGWYMNPGVYLSRDGGTSWSKINRGLGQPDKIVDVKPDPEDPTVLWCASWGCGWFKGVIRP